MNAPAKYEDVLFQLAQESEALIVMTAENRAAIRNLPPKIGRRFIDVGICEQTMIGAAAGLALRGRRPVCHALATFLTLRAFEFIRTDLGIPRLPVKLVGGVPGFLSDGNGPTHQAIEDVAIMRGIPNFTVFCPADEVELAEGMRVLLRDDRPGYVRYNPHPALIEHQPFTIGRAEVVHEGQEIAILTYGFLLREALIAHRILSAAGRSVRLVNLRMLKPVDEAELLRAAECRLVVTIEDHFKTGGLYSILAETLLGEQRTARVLPIALEERWFKPALLDRVLEHEGFTGEQLAARIEAALRESR
jgi:transketolase